jgi:hypothetical protein
MKGGMVNNMDITRYWQAVLTQDPDLMTKYKQLMSTGVKTVVLQSGEKI